MCISSIQLGHAFVHCPRGGAHEQGVFTIEVLKWDGRQQLECSSFLLKVQFVNFCHRVIRFYIAELTCSPSLCRALPVNYRVMCTQTWEPRLPSFILVIILSFYQHATHKWVQILHAGSLKLHYGVTQTKSRLVAAGKDAGGRRAGGVLWSII